MSIDTRRARDCPQQAGDLCASLDEAVDIVDQDHDVRMEIVAEILRDGQGAVPDAKMYGRWLVHLTEHQHNLLEDTGSMHCAIALLRLSACSPAPQNRLRHLIVPS